MEVFLLFLIGAGAIAFLKAMRGLSDQPTTTTEDDDLFDEDSICSTSSSDTHRSLFEDDDSPARGSWDPTSTYYDHSNHHHFD